MSRRRRKYKRKKIIRARVRERKCLVCRVAFWVKKMEKRKRRVCSNACKDLALKRKRVLRTVGDYERIDWRVCPKHFCYLRTCRCNY